MYNRKEMALDNSSKLHSEQGVALITGMVVAVIAVSIAGALAVEVQSRHKQTITQAQTKEAELLALSGIEKIKRFLYVYKSTGTWTWSDILKYNQYFNTDTESIKNTCQSSTTTNTMTHPYGTYQPGGYTYTTSTMDTWPEGDVPQDKTTPSSSPTVFGTPTSYGKGKYHLVIKNDNDDPDPLVDTNNILDVIATSVTDSGTIRQLRVRIRYITGNYSPLAALTTGGNIKISGTTKVLGSLGSVHTNMSALVEETPTISQKLTAVGTITVTGTPSVGGGIWPGSARVPLPEVDPNDYRSNANYILRADGAVINNLTGLPIVMLGNNGMWNGFKYTVGAGGKWQANGNAVLESATYFIDTPFTLNGNASAPSATFLVNNSVTVAGTADTSGNGQMTVIAKGDMVLAGSATLKGFLACQEQVKINGTPKVIGAILAQDKQDLYNDVSTQNQVFPDTLVGTASVTYDAQMTTILKVATRVAPVAIWRLK